MQISSRPFFSMYANGTHWCLQLFIRRGLGRFLASYSSAVSPRQVVPLSSLALTRFASIGSTKGLEQLKSARHFRRHTAAFHGWRCLCGQEEWAQNFR